MKKISDILNNDLVTKVVKVGEDGAGDQENPRLPDQVRG